MSRKLNQLATLIIFIIVVVALFSRQQNKLASFAQDQAQVDAPSAVLTPTPSPQFSPSVATNSTATASPSAKTYQFEATVSGQKALDLVQSRAKLELKKYDFGLMIEAVNGLKADAKHYWALYQGGDYAQVGISEIKLQKGEQIELRYEEIKL